MSQPPWTPIRHDTPSKPEVWEIARITGLDPDAVLGKLIRIWIWFDSQSVDGHAPSVTKMLLDREVGHAGFCDAVIAAGWFAVQNGNLVMVNFDYHTGKGAKKRLLDARRQQKARDIKRHAQNVTGSVTSALPQEEEDSKKNSSTKSSKKKRVFKPPTLDEVVAYCAERGKGVDAEQWHDFYSAKDWMIGRNKMKDWKAAVRTWEKNRGNGSGQNSSASRPTGKTSAREHNQQLGDYLDRELRKELDGT